MAAIVMFAFAPCSGPRLCAGRAGRIIVAVHPAQRFSLVRSASTAGVAGSATSRFRARSASLDTARVDAAVVDHASVMASTLASVNVSDRIRDTYDATSASPRRLPTSVSAH